MKTTSSRSLGALCAVAVIISTLVVGTSVKGQGYIALGPQIPTQQFVNDAAYAMSNGLTSYGLWVGIPNGSSIDITNVFTSGANGQVLYFGFAFTNMAPFTLGGIMSTQTIGSIVYSGTLSNDGITYTSFGVGVGINGSVYTTGNANSLVNGVYGTGYSYAIGIDGQTIQQAALTWASSTPLIVGASYTINGQTILDQITLITPVPEPGSTKIILCGLGGLVFMILKRQKVSKPQ